MFAILIARVTEIREIKVSLKMLRNKIFREPNVAVKRNIFDNIRTMSLSLARFITFSF